MNTFKFYIFKPYTKKAIKASVNYRIPGNFEEVEATPVYPLGIGNFLDERLDEAYITIYNSSTEHYKAKTICKVEIYEGEKVAATKFYIIGNDNSIELPVGSGKYKHDLFLIEPTKLLEGVVCQSLTFTNPLHPYAESAPASVAEIINPTSLVSGAIEAGAALSPSTPTYIKSITIPSMQKIADTISYATEVYFDILDSYNGNATKLTVGGIDYTDTNKDVVVSDFQEITITYNIHVNRKNYPDVHDGVYDLIYFSYKITYEERYPQKPYTITTMTQRCLELAKPICDSNVITTMFSFDGVSYPRNKGVFGNATYNEGSQSALYNEEIATELVLTENTLREQLKTIGHLIHSEPRVNVIDSGNKEAGYSTTLGFSILYEPYDAAENAVIGKPYVYKGINQSINEYCDSIRSNAKNIVNLLDYAQGTLADPIGTDYKGTSTDPYDTAEFKSVRSETINIRVSAGNGLCETAFPIYDIIKVECGIVSQDGWEKWATEYSYSGGVKKFNGTPVDITPFVVEKSTYDTLDGYTKYGKALALYYTRGQKNIEGLFFKRAQVSISQAYDEYAIANIFNVVRPGQNIGFEDVVKCVFKVTYIPVYNSVVSHGKQSFSVSELFEPSYTIPYNQSENIIESRFYGENIKGVAARLGNVECERTYIFDKLSDIPKNGQILDGYTICTSNTQMLPTHYKTTLALSKDFNRINQYIGVSQNKRTYEVSEREAYERNVLLNAKVIISEGSFTDGSYLVQQNGMQVDPIYFRDLITNTNYSQRQICNVVAMGKKKNGSPLTPVILPVVSSSFGNVISFTWEYKDNYSAGEAVHYYNEDGVSGYWGKDIPYSDNYGCIYSYKFALLWRGIFTHTQFDDLPNLPLNMPAITKKQFNTLYNLGPIKVSDMLLKKDSRERLKFNAQFEFVTDVPYLIIGSGMAACSDFTSLAPRGDIKLYLIKGHISKFDTNISGFEKIECHSTHPETIAIFSNVTSGEYGEGLPGVSINFKNIYDGGDKDLTPLYKAYPEYTSWAIAKGITTQTKTYVDENGNKVTIDEQTGGEILLASNTIPRDTSGIPLNDFTLYFKVAS